ncbi:putative KAP-like P-loop ATPase [Novosphingobium sp. PhB165]|uniref:KAP family P-loop NTPase fold protein n=1 Tax=Novosphingobium sp. PhB165 TaxID=2485105 RepID=UPI0010455542|nr:KAP family NTPase [Novosphingobium sp. PhB165]TCM12855.1 putative KAP-like P-loop ATPase [Novosphingobium sp. PhB165]
MWSDRESNEDFLNFTEIADQVATLTSRRDMLPVSIGVFGTWGTGKSTVLKLVKARLEIEDAPPLVIEFDAWLYQGFDDAKAALMEVVADRLLTAAAQDKDLLDKVKAFAARVNYFRAIGMVADFGVGMAFGVPPGLLTKAGNAISSIVSGHAKPGNADELKEIGKEAAEGWSKLIKPEKAKTPPKEIEAFRKEFAEILEKLDRTLVLFIDNLDRCLPDVAIGTLEAVRLFLFMPRTAFVVAADEDMIRHSVAKHFHDPNGPHVRDYLDKVIQVPFHVPRVGVEDVRAYMYSLFVQQIAPDALSRVQERLLTALQRGWKGETFAANEIEEIAGKPVGLLEMLGTADRLAGILATAPRIEGNPRIIKRLLNAVVMRRALAQSRKMNVDLATLAKLAIFERGTDAEATQALYSMVMAGGTDAERLIAASEEFDEGFQRPQSPTSWKAHEAFIEQWRSLEPRFRDPDLLHPALFLSRDVMAPSHRRNKTDAVAQAIDGLLGVTSLNSPTATRIIGSLGNDERVAVMEGIVSRLREGDWTTKLGGVHGALLLGDASAEARRVLQALVTDIASTEIHTGLRYALRQKKYLGEG